MHPVWLRCSSLKYSRIPGILGRRALPTGRIAALVLAATFTTGCQTRFHKAGGVATDHR